MDDPREEIPSGLPPEAPEEQPLGVPEADPDHDHTPSGPAGMPGIPDGEEPPSGG